MFAATNGDFSTVKLLLRYGADVHVTNHEGKTVKDIANERGYNNILNLIIAYGIIFSQSYAILKASFNPVGANFRLNIYTSVAEGGESINITSNLT